MAYQANTAKCPACGAEGQPVHDRRARTWRHLDFFQFEAHIHCELPRIGCTQCGKTTQLPVPWARVGSRFTLMFEALALTLAREMPVSVAVCARILRCSDGRRGARSTPMSPPPAPVNRTLRCACARRR